MYLKRKVKESQGLWLLFGITVWVILQRDKEWMALLTAAALHESGHLLAARLCGVRVKGFRFSLLGARMALEGLLSYGKEFFIALGGPLVNFLCVGVTWLCPWGQTDGGALFFYASLGLGLLNLLPVGTLDGGRMLTAALSGVFSPEAAARCVGVTTGVCLGSLWMLTVYGLLRGAPVVSLSVFFLYLLLKSGMGRNSGDANG